MFHTCCPLTVATNTPQNLFKLLLLLPCEKILVKGLILPSQVNGSFITNFRKNELQTHVASAHVLKASAWTLCDGFLLISIYFSERVGIYQLADSEVFYSSWIQVLVPSGYMLHIEMRLGYRHYFFGIPDFLLKETLTCDSPSVRVIRAQGLTEAVRATVPGHGLYATSCTRFALFPEEFWLGKVFCLSVTEH